MKVYLETPTQSRGIKRVYDALIKYKPDRVEVVKEEKQADLVILHIIGRNNRVRRKVEQLQAKNKPYVMIQYVLKSSLNPDTDDWLPLWQDAKLVWSYYDLPTLCVKDSYYWPFNFYHAPLGVDTEIFYDRELPKRDFIIATNSKHALSESVRECVFAAKRLNKKVFHLGHELRRGDDVICLDGISDKTLANFYSRSMFVSGLRRTEGFELPVIEGLMCGAIPIVFDRPEMRHWYHDLAIFIPEGNRDEVIDSLEKIFWQGATPVTEKEKKIAKERFNWETIITNFWSQII